MGFCWDDGRTFLVKAFFTFGQRTVPMDWVHVHITTDAPILFYRYDPEQAESRFRQRFRVLDRRFHTNDEFLYDRFVLQPVTTYGVTAGTTYCIVTVEKTLLSVWVVPEGCRDYRLLTTDRARQHQREDDECVAVYFSEKEARRDSAGLQQSTDASWMPASDGGSKQSTDAPPQQSLDASWVLPKELQSLAGFVYPENTSEELIYIVE
ncbi:hypothetical protein AVEN_221918-1 [Araneus ventricosus]|uniref:Uncharacterized protein n=1 Tax=Araneus ventricosus TaxID=182803 RepID=A0A4Y2F649_ARAVE|nr:hypothetical protein AVEN_221918-1 [Araneus ventricosus]